MSERATNRYDVLVVGGGPAGAVCAAVAAKAGLSVCVLERARFPREKVCGDCINPRAWPVLERLGIADRVMGLPHAPLEAVDFVDARGRVLTSQLPASGRGEIAVKRSALDALLLGHAQECGAAVMHERTVMEVERLGAGWRVGASDKAFECTTLVAADGRNSTVARLLGLMPPAAKDRVGLQTHLPLPEKTRGRVVMRFLPQGYCGLADVGNGEANLCLVARPAGIGAVKSWAVQHFGLPEEQAWRSITPLEREPISPYVPGLLLVGDTARVVEPFTGEGITHALATGELAGRCIAHGEVDQYTRKHADFYRGRLWVNGISRIACKHPAAAGALLGVARIWPGVLQYLTRKVAGA